MKQTYPLVLVIDENPASRRLLCETLTAFKQCEMESTGDTLLGYQKAISLPVHLLVISLTLAKVPGTVLYELLDRTYPKLRRSRPTPPPVIYLGNPGEPQARAVDFHNDPRVKGVLLRPLKLQAILDSHSGLLKDRTDTPLTGLFPPPPIEPV